MDKTMVAMLAATVLGDAVQRRRTRADDRGRRQGVHRAADHDRDDRRAAQGQGLHARPQGGHGQRGGRAALENGQIDVYWEYTGTGLGVFNKITDKFASADDAYKRIKEVDAAKGIVWLNMSAVNNTYAFAMNKDEAQKRGIVTMSDLAKAVKGGAKLTFASNAEFYARPDGLPGWQTAYGFEFERDNVKRMDTGLTYCALKDRQVDSAVVFATDGRIPAFNFVVLKDDKNYAAPYNLTPVVRKEMLDKNPKLAEPLNALVGEAQRRQHGEAQRERRRRQEDRRRGRRRLPQGERADLSVEHAMAEGDCARAMRSPTSRHSRADWRTPTCPPMSSRKRSAACST